MFKQQLALAGLLTLAIALFQFIIGFSPAVSRYFGAPEWLGANRLLLLTASCVIAGMITLFGLYALSGAGYIRSLPLMRPMLVVISGIFILRGLLIIPEILAVIGALPSPIPVAPRLVVFSAGALVTGGLYLKGAVDGWRSFPTQTLKEGSK